MNCMLLKLDHMLDFLMSDAPADDICGEYVITPPRTNSQGVTIGSIVITRNDDGTMMYKIDKFDTLVPEYGYTDWVTLPDARKSDVYSSSHGDMIEHSKQHVAILDIQRTTNAISFKLKFQTNYWYTGFRAEDRIRDQHTGEMLNVTAIKN